MANFVLADQVSELAYDFKPYAGSGIVPEPSSMQIQAFRQALASMMTDLPVESGPQGATVELVKKISDYLSADTSELTEKILHAAADVCSNSPSFDDLQALPYRAQQAFLGWLTGVFLVPEAQTLATKG
jgi:hypothetical protein